MRTVSIIVSCILAAGAASIAFAMRARLSKAAEPSTASVGSIAAKSAPGATADAFIAKSVPFTLKSGASCRVAVYGSQTLREMPEYGGQLVRTLAIHQTITVGDESLSDSCILVTVNCDGADPAILNIRGIGSAADTAPIHCVTAIRPVSPNNWGSLAGNVALQFDVSEPAD